MPDLFAELQQEVEGDDPTLLQELQIISAQS
jgi:hypothetical protein